MKPCHTLGASAALLAALAAPAAAAEAPAAEAPGFPWLLGGQGPLDALILDVEAGPVAIVRNDQRYGDAGTLFNAGQVGQQRNLAVGNRISAEARWADRHAAILLWAPFDLGSRFTTSAPLSFRDTTFPTGTVLDSRYLFEGFRGSYLYRLAEGERWQLEGGASVQVRNAQVSMSAVDGTRFATESDIGFVPALKGRFRYALPQGPYTVLELDGLSSFGAFGVPGGIYDGVVALGCPLMPGLNGELRLRWLGGGAEVRNRQIYNWGDFASATAGLRWTIGGRDAAKR